MIGLVGKLIAEYAEFQRRRPHLPQGDLRDRSEKELEILVTEFQRDRATEGDDSDPTPPSLGSIEHRLAPVVDRGGYSPTSPALSD